MGLLWHVLWLLTYVLQGRDHLSPHGAPDCTLLDDDVALHFQLRETTADEEVIC